MRGRPFNLSLPEQVYDFSPTLSREISEDSDFLRNGKRGRWEERKMGNLERWKIGDLMLSSKICRRSFPLN